jgi:hypothetical protein
VSRGAHDSEAHAQHKGTPPLFFCYDRWLQPASIATLYWSSRGSHSSFPTFQHWLQRTLTRSDLAHVYRCFLSYLVLQLTSHLFRILYHFLRKDSNSEQQVSFIWTKLHPLISRVGGTDLSICDKEVEVHLRLRSFCLKRFGFKCFNHLLGIRCLTFTSLSSSTGFPTPIGVEPKLEA